MLRWLFHYAFNEFVHCAVLVWLLLGGAVYLRPSCGPLWAVLSCYWAFFAFHSTAAIAVLAYKCITRKGLHRKDSGEPKYPQPEFREFTFKTRDGVSLKVYTSAPEGVKSSGKCMLLGNGLGLRGPNAFAPIFSWFGPEYTYISWDYRGFFASDMPKRIRRMSIQEQANDAVEVLEACGFEKADVMTGFSMGTAIAFEVALLFPEKVDSLVLINGFHGHVFHQAFQMLVRIPLLSDLMDNMLELLLANSNLLEQTRKHAIVPLVAVLKMYPKVMGTLGSPLLTKIDGNYLPEFLEQYFGNLCKSQKNSENYLRLFQELNAHSVKHLLCDIQHPVLIISGMLDPLCPALACAEIARRIPHSQFYVEPMSTHATLLEAPERCVEEIDTFLRSHKPKFERTSSTIFVEQHTAKGPASASASASSKKKQ